MTLTDVALVIRQKSEMFLADQCTIESYTGYATIDGEYVEHFTTSSGIACRVINKSGKNQNSFGNQSETTQILVNVQTTMLQLPYSTEISTKDKIVYNSIIYDVTYVPIKHSLMGAFIVGVEKQK
jgi:hypothetical protein